MIHRVRGTGSVIACLAFALAGAWGPLIVEAPSAATAAPATSLGGSAATLPSPALASLLATAAQQKANTGSSVQSAGSDAVGRFSNLLGTVRDTLYSSLEIAALLLLLALVVVLVRWLFKDTQQMTILPFQVGGKEETYSSQAIADAFVAEINRIATIHGRRIPGVKNERISLSSVAPSGASLNDNIANIGTVGVSQTEPRHGEWVHIFATLMADPLSWHHHLLLAARHAGSQAPTHCPH
jgi:hypothetical protein